MAEQALTRSLRMLVLFAAGALLGCGDEADGSQALESVGARARPPPEQRRPTNPRLEEPAPPMREPPGLGSRRTELPPRGVPMPNVAPSIEAGAPRDPTVVPADAMRPDASAP